jgi:small subunit ribosomal protein S17
VNERGRRKTLVGKVVSNKMDKTAVVAVERREPHPLYRKIVRSTKRYKAHDPNNTAVLGDVVRIVESRPISREKRWRIAQTLVRGNVADVAPRDIGVPEEPVVETPVAAASPPPVAAVEPAAESTPVAAATEEEEDGRAVSEEASEPEAEPRARSEE